MRTYPSNDLLTSCPWGPATAHRLGILTEMYGIYCHVPARWGLHKPPWLRTATRHGPRDPLVRCLGISKKKKKKDGPYTGPVLLRQGEPGTSQYMEIGPLHRTIVMLRPQTFSHNTYHYAKYGDLTSNGSTFLRL